METVNFRKTIFQRAWQIVKSTGKSFAVALAKAWQLYRLSKKMQNEIVTFAYEKVDGSLRKAVGTLKDVQQFIKGGSNSPKDKVFHYWDLESVAFRSFKVENLITIY